MIEKYPPTFKEATHALVLRTKRADGWLFGGVVPIVRRPGAMIAIKGQSGATYTFTPELDEKGKECGHLLQAFRPGEAAQRFRIIPFNPIVEDSRYSGR